MRAKQWETRQVVLEEHGVLPIDLCVAGFTLCAK